MGGEGSENFAELDIEEVMVDDELDAEDLLNIINQTNDYDKDSNEEGSKLAAFSKN